MIKPIKINKKAIGEGNPTFLIAEMACAHQGNVDYACDLVEVANRAKTDAIQIQVFKKEFYMSPIYKDYDLIKRLELTQEEWLKVIKLIKNNNLLCFAAGYDSESIKFLINQGIDAFKIHSADISNPKVLKIVAESGKPVFLSTGASTIYEIKKAIEFFKINGTVDIVLMHGYQGYPTKLEDTNLKYIKTLERLFGLNVGFYDHVDGGTEFAKIIPFMAIGYGAKVIEKHYILSRKEKGIDYQSSLEPNDFVKFCENLRSSELAIGDEKIRNFTEGEINYRAHCKKSIVAARDINKGEEITRDTVMFVRNDPGIPPDKFFKIKGKITKKYIKKYHNITYNDF